MVCPGLVNGPLCLGNPPISPFCGADAHLLAFAVQACGMAKLAAFVVSGYWFGETMDVLPMPSL